MTLKYDRVFCDHCNREIERVDEEEGLNDILGHGWPKYQTAYVHSCYECSNRLWNPPCGICHSHRCERGIGCWASPPLHLFPYETYYADLVDEYELWQTYLSLFCEKEDTK